MPPRQKDQRGNSAAAHAKNDERKATPDAEPTKPTPEEALETGATTPAVEQSSELRGEDRLPALRDEGDTEDKSLELSKQDQQAAIAGSMGGADNYPYVDRTQIPVHERDITVNSPLTEVTQAEANPAFYPQGKDGGPVSANDESIGTEPNVHEKMLAAAENSGDDDAVQQVQDQIDAGEKQQMDVEAVNAAATAPPGIDPLTGAKESMGVTPPGAPSGMEPSPTGEEGTAGATDSNDEGTSQSDVPKP